MSGEMWKGAEIFRLEKPHGPFIGSDQWLKLLERAELTHQSCDRHQAFEFAEFSVIEVQNSDERAQS